MSIYIKQYWHKGQFKTKTKKNYNIWKFTGNAFELIEYGNTERRIREDGSVFGWTHRWYALSKWDVITEKEAFIELL